MMADVMGFTIFPVFFLLMFVLVALVFIFNISTQVRNRRAIERNRQHDVLDAKTRAQRWIDRLGSEIMMAVPEEEQAKQLVGLAVQRHAGALGQISSAQTLAQARVAQDMAVEGLYYMRDARSWGSWRDLRCRSSAADPPVAAEKKKRGQSRPLFMSVNP